MTIPLEKILDSIEEKRSDLLFKLNLADVPSSKTQFEIPKEILRFLGSENPEALLTLTLELLKVSNISIGSLKDLFETFGYSISHSEWDSISNSDTVACYLNIVSRLRSYLGKFYYRETSQGICFDIPRYQHLLVTEIAPQLSICYSSTITISKTSFLLVHSQNLKECWQKEVLKAISIASLSNMRVELIFLFQELFLTIEPSTDQELISTLIAKAFQCNSPKVDSGAIVKRYNIGTHTQNDGGVEKTVKTLPGGVPFQIYLSNSRSYSIELRDADVTSVYNSIVQRGVILFAHSPLVINLCTDSKIDRRSIDVLSKYLHYGAKMGIKGVVVHVGKSTTQDLSTAMNNFRNNVSAVLKYATTECPLLLETPAGQGTEMLTVVEDFVGFIKEFNDDRFGACCDTCHVNSLGYIPSQYLQKMTQFGLSPKLIHYNDSKTALGSRVDRHAGIGLGTIGIEELNRTAHLASTLKIPMLIE